MTQKSEEKSSSIICSWIPFGLNKCIVQCDGIQTFNKVWLKVSKFLNTQSKNMSRLRTSPEHDRLCMLWKNSIISLWISARSGVKDASLT